VKRNIVVAVLIVATALVVLLLPEEKPKTLPEQSRTGVAPVQSGASEGQAGRPSHSDRSASPDSTTSPLPPASAPVRPADIELAPFVTVIRDYRAKFGENPVGSNAEITRALSKFVQAERLPVNAQGELVDRWGTPLFFHQLSGEVMEIRSAGPDQKMWTSDDLVTR